MIAEMKNGRLEDKGRKYFSRQEIELGRKKENSKKNSQRNKF